MKQTRIIKLLDTSESFMDAMKEIQLAVHLGQEVKFDTSAIPDPYMYRAVLKREFQIEKRAKKR